MHDDTLRFFLQEALDSPMGVVVETNERILLRNKLYAVRRSHKPLFDGLSIVLPPAQGELWIVKKEPADGEAEEP